MFGFVFVLLSALVQARLPVIPIVPSLYPRCFDAEDLEDKKHRFYYRVNPVAPSVFADDEVENKKINWGEITKIAGQVNQIGKILGFDAEDLDDKKHRFYYRVKSVAPSALVDDEEEDFEDKFHLGKLLKRVAPLVLAEDEVENKKINWGEITKIAGQVNQIGKVLGFDVEDLDDKKINLDEIAKIAGQTQQIIQILKSDDEDFENGLGKKLKKLGKKISHGIRHGLPKVTEIAGKVNKIGQVLGYEAEDAEDKFHLGHIIGNVLPLVLAEDEVENKKINWSEITKIAGQVNQIGQILGFDAEDADDKFHLGHIIGHVAPLLLDADEEEEIENMFQPILKMIRRFTPEQYAEYQASHPSKKYRTSICIRPASTSVRADN